MSGMFGVSRKMHARKSVEWYTPAWVFDELGLQFDLDPASPYDMESFIPATTKYTVFDNGLQKDESTIRCRYQLLDAPVFRS